MILYEYPFNERVRSLLRLEDQLDRLFYFACQEDARAHHAALTVLFDIVDATTRSDLVGDLLRELERQRVSLVALREHPAVEPGILDTIIQRLQDVGAALSAQGKPADILRNHEWLNSLRSRLVIPGGVCEFDMPSYFAWQHRPIAERVRDLRDWCSPLLALHDGVAELLQLLREAGPRVPMVAPAGNFQQSSSGKTWQLLRVFLPEDTRIFPEISANKYAISIRFSSQEGSGKPLPVTDDVPFELALCSSLASGAGASRIVE